MQQEELYSKAYLTALRFIVHKPRTQYEVVKRITSLINKLNNSKIISPEDQLVIDKVINTLKSEKYINDDYYVREYVTNGLSNKKKSVTMIKKFLIGKGINIKEYAHVISGLDQEYEYTSALEAGRKKLNVLPKEKNYVIRGKIYSFLLRKGYSSEAVEHAIDTLLGVK